MTDTIKLTQQTRQLIRGCKRCFLNTVGNGPISFSGFPNSHADIYNSRKVMVVGQNPGKDEDEGGKPFIGPAGRLFRELMQAVGMDDKKLFWANVNSCHSPGNRQPTAMEVVKCQPNRKLMYQLCRPEYVLLAGEFALQVYKPHLKIQWQHGRPFEWREGELLDGVMNEWGCTTVWATYHPAAALPGRNQALQLAIKEDLRALMKFMEDGRYPETCVVCRGQAELADSDGISWCERHKARQEKLFGEES